MWSLLLAACTSDDGQPSDGSTAPVAFSATMASDNKPTTRASGDDTSTSAFGQVIDNDKLQPRGFGVFACYTGLHGYGDSNVHPDFMYNQQVVWQEVSPPESSSWTYSPVKLWPNGEGEVTGNTGSEKHYVSFMAYAPYSEANNNDPSNEKAADYCISSFSLQREIGNPWLTYRLHTNVEKQVDLLYAKPFLDQSKPATDEKLEFKFKHALACVGDQITIICSEGLKNQTDARVSGSNIAKVEVSGLSIEYTLTSKARLVLWCSDEAWTNGEANWQTILSEDPTCKRTVNIIASASAGAGTTVYTKGQTEDPSTTVKDRGVFYIPTALVGYKQTAKVNITYHIATSSDGSTWTSDTDISGTATIAMNDYPAAYRASKHLYINVTLNQRDIELTAAIAPWEDGGTVDVEGIEE